MSRSGRTLLGLLALGLLVLWPIGCLESSAQRPRNVILISIDTLRADHLSCYGHERDTSPAIDRLAAQGVRFSDVTAAAPWCLPAHATMLTGLYPSHHGVKSHESRLSEDTITLAEEFRDHGFETLSVVNSWILGEDPGMPRFQLGQGFDQLRYIREFETVPDTSQVDAVDNGEKVVASAQTLLSRRKSGQPFFLFLHFYDAHSAYAPRPQDRERFVSLYSGPLTGRTPQLIDMDKRGETLTEADLRWLQEMYDAEIRQLDDVLGGFFAWLDEQDLDDDTLIVLTSDHGEEFGEHGGLLHGRTLSQEVLAIPPIVKGPGVPRERTIRAPSHLVDVAPTILSLVGITPRTKLDGIDLSTAWRAPDTFPALRPLFAEADHHNVVDGKASSDTKAMVRLGSTKLCVDKQTGETQLYELGADPREENDLAPERPDQVDALRDSFERFRATEVEPDLIPKPAAEEHPLLIAPCPYGSTS